LRFTRSTLAALAALSLLAAACGTDPDGTPATTTEDPAESAPDEDTETNEGDPEADDAVAADELEITDVKYVIFSTGIPSRHTLAAKELGYFEEVGLDVEIVEAGSPGDVIPLIASGEANFGFLGYESGFNAANAGIDLVMLRELQRNVEEGQQLWANKQSGIETVADLEGRSVAVAGVGGFADLLLAEALATEGMTLDDITLVELPPPATIPALLEGRVDAAWLPGPFAASMLAQEDPPLTFVLDFEDVPALEGIGIGPLWAMRGWVEEHPNTTKAFLQVLDRIAAEFEADPELDREQLALIVPEMSPEIVERHALYPYTGPVPVERVEETQERFLEYGIIDAPVDVQHLAYEVN
jgi:NitT/TauT family transport system substrate-binding protein